MAPRKVYISQEGKEAGLWCHQVFGEEPGVQLDPGRWHDVAQPVGSGRERSDLLGLWVTRSETWISRHEQWQAQPLCRKDREMVTPVFMEY